MDSNLTTNAVEATPMSLFGIAHLVPLLLLTAFILGLWKYKVAYCPPKKRTQLGPFISWVLCFSFPAYVGLQFFKDSLTWDTALPLYPCPLASLLAPIVFRTKNQTLFDILFYWVFAGTLQAVITPEIKSTFPHYEYFYFWVCHGGLLAFLAVLIVAENRSPSKSGILTAFICLNALIAVAWLTNSLTGSNFFYLREKPVVPTLLDYLGPWPWYILGAQIVALTQFILSYWAFRAYRDRFGQLVQPPFYSSPLQYKHSSLEPNLRESNGR